MSHAYTLAGASCLGRCACGGGGPRPRGPLRVHAAGTTACRAQALPDLGLGTQDARGAWEGGPTAGPSGGGPPGLRPLRHQGAEGGQGPASSSSSSSRTPEARFSTLEAGGAAGLPALSSGAHLPHGGLECVPLLAEGPSPSRALPVPGSHSPPSPSPLQPQQRHGGGISGSSSSSWSWSDETEGRQRGSKSMTSSSSSSSSGGCRGSEGTGSRPPRSPEPSTRCSRPAWRGRHPRGREAPLSPPPW